MKPWRRITGWLALLGVVLYGLAPAFACLAPRAAVPLACATAAVHQCSCRPDPHGAKSCCCAKPDASADCSVGKLPCDGGTPTEVAQTLVTNPLSPVPAGIPALRVLRQPSMVAMEAPSPRALAPSPNVPPPRLLSAIS